MPGLRRLVAWWRARRADRLDRLASSDPRMLSTTEQSQTAAKQHREAATQTGDAKARLRELDALRAFVTGKPLSPEEIARLRALEKTRNVMRRDPNP